jgi:transposase InsO family protein
VLVKLGLVEQRHKAVLEVLSGTPITDVARRYGVTRQTVHTWLRHYARSGIAGLVDRSSRPKNCPHQMPAEMMARVLELRRAHPRWGPRTIRHQLAREGVDRLPGRSSIYRCLVRHGLIDPQKRRRRREDYKRWERTRPMELWQMDVMGGVTLEDGSELKIVTGLDDHSRFCVSALLVPRATARPVCEALAAALRRYGVPDQILTDNGKVFSGRFGPNRGEVLFDRILRENGIRHLLTAPHSPTTTGKVERFHKTVRSEFLAKRAFASLEEAQAELDAWVRAYNHTRPHQGIGMVSPARRFASGRPEGQPPLLAEEEEEWGRVDQVEPPSRRAKRKVSASGSIRLAGLVYHVGRFLSGETVEAEFGRDGLIGIYHQSVLVATLVRRHPAEAEEAALRRRPYGTGTPQKVKTPRTKAS